MVKEGSKHAHEQPAAGESDQDQKLSYEQLTEKLQAAEQKATQNWDRVLRMQADIDNLHRRTERDIANAHKYSLEKFVNELLPIVDSLELCIANSKENDAQSIIAGVDLTLKMFYSALEKFGIQQVNPVNEMFDPEHQQAISTQVDEKVQANTVLSVLQKGYTLNNRLIRPALVVVSKKSDES